MKEIKSVQINVRKIGITKGKIKRHGSKKIDVKIPKIVILISDFITTFGKLPHETKFKPYICTTLLRK